MGTVKATRRRGPALEDAILSAAWDELVERGYANFTLESVALRAGTSRPVLYRRWRGRAELARAALAHYVSLHPISVPDVGSVREELATLLRELSAKRAPMSTMIMLNMSGYFAETNSSLADLRNEMADRGVADRRLIDDILRRGIERGEIDPQKLTPRIASLPVDLARHEMMMTMEPLPDSVIAEILDEVFLPLVRRDGGRRPDPERHS
jgi:AcrR family transcriptional regulator